MVFDTFIAANTAKGFFSYFDELLYGEDINRVYLIKGGPGCGKSTFMKKTAAAFAEKGCSVEKILCSSDNGSLDGVKIQEKGIVIIDATSPHAYDMKYPGAYESLLDFSVFWDEKKLEENRTDIKKSTNSISAKYRSVYNLLKAAGSIETRKGTLIEAWTDSEKILKCIKKIIKQNAIVQVESKPQITNRMLSAFSGEGIYTISETTEKLCDEYIVLDDGLGIGYIFLAKAASVFTRLGYDTIRIHSPLLPESRLEQVLIPQLRIGFITSNNIFSPQVNDSKIIKKINTKSFIDKSLYSENKNKLCFEKKVIKELITAVSEELSEIKAMHDELEAFYINAINHKAIDTFTSEFINKI